MLLKLFGYRLLVTRTYFVSARRFYLQRNDGNAIEVRVGPAFAMVEWGCSGRD